MKLVKLLSKPNSSVAGIVGVPNAEDVVIPSKKSLLISDDRFTLLQHAGVKTKLIKEFSEVAVADIGDFDKKTTYVIADIIVPSTFADLDPADYKQGDYLFVYADEPANPGEPPQMRKPAPGYKFTPQEYVEALQEYNTALATYEAALATYEEDLKTFFATGEGSHKEYGWLIQVVSDTQYLVIADFSFETTKDTAQFGVMGKFPKEVATLVGTTFGGFVSGDSIKGLTVAEVFEKALGLTYEDDIIGELLPEDI